jgi:hypothetical protein
LSLPEREFWGLYAPEAIHARTLTVQTVSAWRLLCQAHTRLQKTAKLLERAEELTAQDGAKYLAALTTLSRLYVALAQRVESLMGRV